MEGTYEQGRVHERKVLLISHQVVKKKSNCPQVKKYTQDFEQTLPLGQRKLYTLCKTIVTIENSRLDCD